MSGDNQALPTLGMVGLGRMGSNLVRRLVRSGGEAVVFDPAEGLGAALAQELSGSVQNAGRLPDLVAALPSPRVVWVMTPAAVTPEVISELSGLLSVGDTVIDGGNSNWAHDAPRARSLADEGISFLDIGTSGGVWGLERGFCLMVGGDEKAVVPLAPLFDELAPSTSAAERTAGRVGPSSQAEHGWLHCGPSGSGHFVKMVHNGVEYGLMAAYAEGLNLMDHADEYGFDLDLGAITELWRRGSVVGSWLLDLTAAALVENPELSGYGTVVSDSGEGRWALQAAVDLGVPSPVLSAALFSRFASRGEDRTANQLLAAMRNQFGGHVENPPAD